MTNLYFGRDDNTIGADCSDIDLKSPSAVGEVLRRAGLDWEVYTQDGLGRSWTYKSSNSVPRFAYRWVDETDDEGNITGNKKKLLLGQFTVNRKIYQNQDVFGAIADFCRNNNLPILRAGSFDQGARQFAVCGINEEFELADNDKVESQLLVTHSHSVGALVFAILTERLVCTNQLVLPSSVKQLRINHRSLFNTTDAVSRLEEIKKGVAEFSSRSQDLSKTAVRTSDLDTAQAATVRGWAIESLGDPNAFISEQPYYVQQLLEDDDMLMKVVALKTALKSGSTIPEPKEEGQQITVEDLPRAYQEICRLYYEGAGSEKLSAMGTAWGSLQAVTNYYNNYARSYVNNFQNVWTGSKANAMQYAYNQTQTVSAML